MRKLVLALTLAAISALVTTALACTKEREAHADCRPLAEDCRPEVNGTLMTGGALEDASLKGKVVMVNFWATWCGPCAMELPSLDKVYQRHKDQGYVSVGVVTADRATDDAVQRFAVSHGVSYPLVRATPTLIQKFAFGDILPTTFVYDRNGRLRAHWDGAINEKALEDEVARLLAE